LSYPKKYNTVGPIPQSNIKIVERGKIDTPNIQIYDLYISLWVIFSNPDCELHLLVLLIPIFLNEYTGTSFILKATSSM